jgi:hypothetical protein
MIERLKNEPVAIVAAIEAALMLALAFGAPLTKEQIAGIMTLALAILAIVARGAVTPTRKLQ